MDQVTFTTQQHIDHLLNYVTAEWEDVTEAAEEWEEWGRDGQILYRLEWPIVESKLERLRSFADRGLLNAEQQTRYNELLRLIERQRPVLDSLMEE